MPQGADPLNCSTEAQQINGTAPHMQGIAIYDTSNMHRNLFKHVVVVIAVMIVETNQGE